MALPGTQTRPSVSSCSTPYRCKAHVPSSTPSSRQAVANLSRARPSSRFAPYTRRLVVERLQSVGISERPRARGVPVQRRAAHCLAQVDGFAAELSAAPKKGVVEVSGQESEIIRIRATNSESTSDDAEPIVVLPGNPGMVTYYSDFACSLWEKFNGTRDVYVLGYLGHSEDSPPLLTKPPEDTAVFSLQEQINHTVAYLHEHVLTSAARCVLVGHSIGAHVALEAMGRCEPSQVKGVLGVHPFLTSQTQSENRFQGFLNLLVHLPPVVAACQAVVWLLCKLSAASKSWLLTPYFSSMGMEPPAVQLTIESLVRVKSYRNFVYMGKTEFDDLEGGVDWDLLIENGNDKKIGFIFGREDIWAPQWLRADIEHTTPGVDVREEPRYSHMFSVTRQGASDVAHLTVEMIESFP